MNVQRPLSAVWFCLLAVSACRDPVEPARIDAARLAEVAPPTTRRQMS